MAKVFLDTNYFIGLVNRTPETDSAVIDNNETFISPLSCHILFYVNKIDVPDEAMNSFINDFNLVILTERILKKALDGPTSDLEDNVQLHSAAEADCDLFLTNDQALLKMRFFGKTEILPAPFPKKAKI